MRYSHKKTEVEYFQRLQKEEARLFSDSSHKTNILESNNLTSHTQDTALEVGRQTMTVCISRITGICFHRLGPIARTPRVTSEASHSPCVWRPYQPLEKA